jgi:NDP-sugar pyrophosphorylase family protein
MKALILAGGYATRLRPLSCEKPKLLFPIAGKPMLERTLDTLSRNNVSSIVLAVNYMADKLKKHFGSKHGKIRITYSLEPRPLGTGGPIKLAQKLLESEDTFLAMNGDILFEENLSRMLQVHKKEKSIATIALHMVDDASRFGLVEVNDAMRVSSFVEKPKKQDPIQGLINAGIYLMSPAIFDYIPSGKKVSIEREVFPILAEEEKLLGYELKGYWTDIGKIKDYLEANFSFLKMESPDKPVVMRGAKVSDRAILKPPCLVMNKTTVGDNAVIGPFTVAGEGSVVEEHAHVERSVLFSDVHIGKSSKVFSSIVGDGAEVSRDVRLEETVLGDRVTVSQSLKLAGGVRVCPHKDVTEDVLGPVDICS